MPTRARRMPTPSSTTGKYPLFTSLLDKYARTNNSAATAKGVMILAIFNFHLLENITLQCAESDFS